MSTKGKKVKIIYFISLIMSLFVMNLNARESGYSISAAFVGMNMDYREYGVTDANGYGIYNGPKNLEKILDSEKSNAATGLMIGADIDLGYKKVLESGNYAEVKLSGIFTNGETEYVGSYIGSPDGYGSEVNSTKNIVMDIDIDYKFSHVLNNTLTLSYGMGFGYRLWRRELNAAQIEVYKWMSFRPHIGTIYRISKFSLGINIEYQYAINPEMTILGNVNQSDLTVNLDGANIVQISIPFEVALYDNVDLFVIYTYENQIIGKSDQLQLSNGSLWEPRSEANNQYLKLGATFKF